MSKETINLEKIINDAKMRPDPGYYSGRNATTRDLNDEKLEIIYQRLRKEDEQASLNFAMLVKEMHSLTATNFLVAIYRLQGNNWNWDKKMADIDGSYTANKQQADAAILSGFMSFSGIDDTEKIRAAFLERRFGLIERRPLPRMYG